MSSLEKALLTAGALSTAGMLLPEDSEGASVGKTAFDWAKKNWMKNNPGQKVLPSQEAEIAKWAVDIPKLLGVSSAPVEKADTSILLNALKHPNFPNLQSSHINTIRAETAALPDILHETIDPTFKFFTPGTNPALQGRFTYSPSKGSTILFNPESSNKGLQTAGHEFGYHAPTYDPAAESLLSPKTLEDVKLMRSIDTQHEIAKNLISKDSSILSPAEENRMFHLYYSKPGEIGARNMGRRVSEAVSAGGESLKAVKDPKEYFNVLSNIAEKANDRAARFNSDLHLYGLGKLAVPAAVGAGVALTANDLMASHEPVMSNTDKTVKEQNISRYEPDSRSLAAANSQLEPGVTIPAGDIGGDFNAGASGAVDAIKGVAGAAGGLVQRTTKSLGKAIDAVTGQRTARSKPIEGDDYERIINSAALFFNPTKVVGNTALGTGFDWVDPVEVGVSSELTPEMLSTKQEFKTTPYVDRKIPEVLQNVALGVGAAGLGALALKSKLLKNEAGAINLPGFISDLTESLKKGVVGKSKLSPNMSGEQLLKTLQSAGIKEDELVFSGVGDALASIGKDRIGPTKFEELKKTAEEGALGFTRKDSPGLYPNYSLFNEGDPAFKNAVYSLPEVKFEESHFGEGVVAHRRFGDKEISYKDPLRKEFVNSINSGFTDNGNLTLEQVQDAKRYSELVHTGDPSIPEVNVEFKMLNDKYMNPKRLNSLLLDEVQSQFHEKGSRFGYGSPKSFTTENMKGDFRDSIKVLSPENKHISELAKEGIRDILAKEKPETFAAAVRFKELENTAKTVDRSTSKGFAKGLQVDAEQDSIYRKYNTTENNVVENIPLRGEKYVELLAKDHLRDALASGKDAISWTPSKMQHERYYGKDALGSVKWEFVDGDPKKKVLSGLNNLSYETGVKFDNFHDAYLWSRKYINKHGSNVDNMTNTEYQIYEHAVKIRDLDALGSDYKVDPKLSIKVPGGRTEVVDSIEQINKLMGSAATKKLLADMQNGITSGTLEGNAKEVYQKLYDRAIPKTFEKLTGEKPREGFVKGRNGEDVKINWIPLDKVKEKMVKEAPKKLSTEAIEKLSLDLPTSVPEVTDVSSINNVEKMLLKNKEKVLDRLKDNYGNSSKSFYRKELEETENSLNKIKSFKENYLPKVKDLPIAHSQEVQNFFNPSQQVNV